MQGEPTLASGAAAIGVGAILGLTATTVGAGALGLPVGLGAGAAAALLLRLRRISLVLSLLSVTAASRGAAYRQLQHPAPSCHVSRLTWTEAFRLQATALTHARLKQHVLTQELRVIAVQAPGGQWRRTCGNVLAKWKVSEPAAKRGQRLLLRARLRPALGQRNPRMSGGRLQFLRRDIGAVAQVVPQSTVVVASSTRRSLVELARARIYSVVSTAPLQTEERAILSALLLGQRDGLPAMTRQRLARAGISHLLAISGLHLSLLCTMIFVLSNRSLVALAPLARRGEPRRWSALLAAVGCIAYTMLSGASEATLRACVMTCAFCCSLLLRRSASGKQALSLAAAGLLAHQPLRLFDVGFQLSFVAAAALLCAHRKREESNPSRIARWAKELLRTSLAASLVTAPLSAHHFDQVALAGPLVNLAAIPLTAFALLPSACLGLLLSLIDQATSTPLLVLSGHVASLIVRMAGWVPDQLVLQFWTDWPTTICLTLLAL